MNKRFAKLIISRMNDASQAHDHVRPDVAAPVQSEKALARGGANYPLDRPSALRRASPPFEVVVRHPLHEGLQERRQSYGLSSDLATRYDAAIFRRSPPLCVSPDTTAAEIPERRAAAAADAPDDQPTKFDVLNGRGQGVQRHPGNVKYRTLIFVNKGLYAKCPKADKAKISKGIVAAVRALGGRFLELDERGGLYRDIGDKKAYIKTSQALREGQTRIRRELDTVENNLRGDVSPAGFTAEGYFGYSVCVLKSLYKSEGEGRRGSMRISPCASPVSGAASDYHNDTYQVPLCQRW